MIVTFWGVRGSIPVPGPDTLRYGGNTACVAVEQDAGILVMDAGTGIRALGDAILGRGREVFLVLSHLHADHLLGFPFFTPLYRRGERVRLLDYRHGGRAFSPIELFDGLHVPMSRSSVVADCECCADRAADYLGDHGFALESIPLNHPGGALGYRVTDGDRTLVHITDNELRPRGKATTGFDAFVAFCRGADVLSHDAQWTAAEAETRRGWGHSSIDDAIDLALAARVKRLVLFHHDPSRTDAQVDRIQAEARERLGPHGIACDAAYEGFRIELQPSGLSIA